MCFVGCISFAWHYGKMYSQHLFSLRWIKNIAQIRKIVEKVQLWKGKRVKVLFYSLKQLSVILKIRKKEFSVSALWPTLITSCMAYLAGRGWRVPGIKTPLIALYRMTSHWPISSTTSLEPRTSSIWLGIPCQKWTKKFWTWKMLANRIKLDTISLRRKIIHALRDKLSYTSDVTYLSKVCS